MNFPTLKKYFLHKDTPSIIFSFFVLFVLFEVFTITFPATPAPRPVEAYATLRERLVATVFESGPRAALDLLFAESEADPDVASQCHALAHALGHTAFHARGGDLAVALAPREDTCGGGYEHGVIEAYLSGVSEKAIPNALQTACSVYPPGSDTDSCYHGVGHGLMFYSANDLPASIKLCDNFANGEARTRCSEGVFMEHFLSDDDVHPSRFLDKDNPLASCATQSARYKASCYFYAPIAFLASHPLQFTEAFSWCDGAERGYASACMRGVGSRLTKENIGRLEVVRQTCAALSGEAHRACVAGAASYHLVHYKDSQKTKQFCATFPPADVSLCNSARERSE